METQTPSVLNFDEENISKIYKKKLQEINGEVISGDLEYFKYDKLSNYVHVNDPIFLSLYEADFFKQPFVMIFLGTRHILSKLISIYAFLKGERKKILERNENLNKLKDDDKYVRELTPIEENPDFSEFILNLMDWALKGFAKCLDEYPEMDYLGLQRYMYSRGIVSENSDDSKSDTISKYILSRFDIVISLFLYRGIYGRSLLGKMIAYGIDPDRFEIYKNLDERFKVQNGVPLEIITSFLEPYKQANFVASFHNVIKYFYTRSPNQIYRQNMFANKYIITEDLCKYYFVARFPINLFHLKFDKTNYQIFINNIKTLQNDINFNWDGPIGRDNDFTPSFIKMIDKKEQVIDFQKIISESQDALISTVYDIRLRAFNAGDIIKHYEPISSKLSETISITSITPKVNDDRGYGYFIMGKKPLQQSRLILKPFYSVLTYGHVNIMQKYKKYFEPILKDGFMLESLCISVQLTSEKEKTFLRNILYFMFAYGNVDYLKYLLTLDLKDKIENQIKRKINLYVKAAFYYGHFNIFELLSREIDNNIKNALVYPGRSNRTLLKILMKLINDFAKNKKVNYPAGSELILLRFLENKEEIKSAKPKHFIENYGKENTDEIKENFAKFFSERRVRRNKR